MVRCVRTRKRRLPQWVIAGSRQVLVVLYWCSVHLEKSRTCRHRFKYHIIVCDFVYAIYGSFNAIFKSVYVQALYLETFAQVIR